MELGRDDRERRGQAKVGHEPYLSRLRTMVGYWMGLTDLGDAVRRGDLAVEGPRRLTSALPGWFRRSAFASVELPVPG